jgi:hypothetical protein
MTDQIDVLLQDEPISWIKALPEYQREPIEFLLQGGSDFEVIAQAWISASAENTFRFSASPEIGQKGTFLRNLKKEVRAYLCGHKKYEKERQGLFGEKAPARTFIISSIAVAIAPHLSVASAVIAPLVALILASFGKITLNAWCAATTNWQEEA